MLRARIVPFWACLSAATLIAGCRSGPATISPSLYCQGGSRHGTECYQTAAFRERDPLQPVAPLAPTPPAPSASTAVPELRITEVRTLDAGSDAGRDAARPKWDAGY